MADYRRSLTDMTPEELQQVAPGFAPAAEVSKPLSVKGAELAVSTLTPLDFAVEVQEELKKDDPDYLYIGAMAGVEAIGALPGLGSAAKNMIRQGAKFKKTPQAVEVESNIPKVSREVKPSYTDAELLDADNDIFEWEKGNLSNPELRKRLSDKGFEIQTKTISPKMTGDDLEVVGPDGNIVRWKDMPRGTDKDVAEAERLLDDPEALKAWQEQNKLPETQRQANPEDAKLAANELFEGEVTSQEARKRIRDAIPDPQEYTAEQVMEMMPTVTEVTGSLGKKAGKYGILGVKGFDLEAGQEVASRLDIPAYNNYDTWVVSIHEGKKDAGSVVGFGQAIRLKNIRFGSRAKDALDIARGKRTTAAGEDKPMGKSTIARIFGDYQPEDPYDLQRQAADIIASGSDEWTQVGMNPYRGSAFYDKATGTPVFSADEVIQVGPLVLAKNVKKPTVSQLKELGVKTRDGKPRMFNEGGAVMDEQMDAVFKSSRTGYAVGGSVDLDSVPDNNVDVDPVSGNPVPLGSSPEEVRDDIPAQLSEGEYVVPADVVRYYGVKFFEELRADAKFGYQDMNENGRIGGEPIGMEMGQDELPFDVSELQVSDDDMPEQAFLGKLFGKKKEKSPEETVRERFKAAEGRDNSARAIAERRAAAIAREMAEKEDNGGSSSASIDLGFSGSPMERAERKYGNKSKPKSNPTGAGSVTSAYTPGGGGETFAERINFGGNYNEGGDVAEQTESLFPDNFNMYGGSGVIYIKYTDGERIIEIPFFNGIPMAVIPEGFYPLGEDVPEVEEEEEAVEAVSDDGGSTPDVPMPDPIDYANLTADELAEMVEQQTTFGMDDGISALLGALNPLAGLFMKGAMMHQAKLTKNELERRVKLEGISDEERARYQSLIEVTEQPNFMQGILGKIKGAFEKKPKEPEIPTIDKQSVTDAVTEAMAYDPTARAVLEDSEITVSELAPIVTPNNKSGEMPKVEPKDPTPFTGTAAYMGYGSEKGNTLGQGDSPTPITDAFGTGNIFTSGKQPKTTPGIDSQADKQNVREQATISDRQRKQAGMGINKESTNKVIYDAAEKGASAQDLKNMAKEAEKVAAALESTAKGGKMGFKKGGLASKKKK